MVPCARSSTVQLVTYDTDHAPLLGNGRPRLENIRSNASDTDSTWFFYVTRDDVLRDGTPLFWLNILDVAWTNLS